MPIPAPKDNPPLGLTTTSGIPKRTIMKFVKAKDILKYLSTSHLVLSTPFSFNCLNVFKLQFLKQINVKKN